jgi:serine/threonine protein kinase
MINKIISHYRILEKIGSGGMGDVYKAKDINLRRLVALKFLPTELTNHEEACLRLVQEAQAASSLDHPNIGTIFEIDEIDGRPFIAMSFYEAISLRELIDTRNKVVPSAKSPASDTISIAEALNIIIQIMEGLTAAHDRGIIHRDIKPANILVLENDKIKIIDFGLAKIMNRTVLTQMGTTAGTIAYMSPEQTHGSKVDHRTDIWAVGVIMYELLTGVRPFKGDYEQAIMYSILNEDPEFITQLRRDIPIEIEKIVEKALKKDPDKRFQTMPEMRDALLKFSDVPNQKNKKSIRSRFRIGRRTRK